MVGGEIGHPLWLTVPAWMVFQIGGPYEVVWLVGDGSAAPLTHVGGTGNAGLGSV